VAAQILAALREVPPEVRLVNRPEAQNRCASGNPQADAQSRRDAPRHNHPGTLGTLAPQAPWHPGTPGTLAPLAPLAPPGTECYFTSITPLMPAAKCPGNVQT
jgi:hypothetical protein